MKAKDTNETYEVEISSPLLRPGLTLRTSVSSRYLVATVQSVLEKVREINSGTVDGTRKP